MIFPCMKAWISIEIVFIIPMLGWFALLRLYGPLESRFERTWHPGEFERLE